MCTGESVEQQLHGADVQVQLVHVVLTEVSDLQVPEQETHSSAPEGSGERSALIGSLLVLPVSLSDSVDRRQLAHQQFEDGRFTGAVFTDLTQEVITDWLVTVDIRHVTMWTPIG